VEGLVLAALVLPDDDDREPENAERAAVRWLRKLLERPDATLAELRQALDAFAVLVEEPDAAEATLRRR
jgi:hypothetical protein